MDYDVIIIGGGPGGLTASIYASRARLKTLLIESFSTPAQALLTDAVENYPGFPDGVDGFTLIEKFKKQAQKFGTKFKVEDVKAVEGYKENEHNGWKVITKDNSYTSLSLIIAAGATHRRLDIPGENKFKGKGVSYCATCDGPLYKDKNVVVIGGGDAAVEEALFMTKFVKKLTLVHRRDCLRAAKILQERVFSNKKIELILDSKPVEISGETKVNKVKIVNIKTNKEKDLFCDGVFVFIGYIPNTDFIKGLVKLDKDGYIITDENMTTSQKGIFACGDCRKKLLRQIVTACGDGAQAAFSTQQYVEGLLKGGPIDGNACM